LTKLKRSVYRLKVEFFERELGNCSWWCHHNRSHHGRCLWIDRFESTKNYYFGPCHV